MFSSRAISLARPFTRGLVSASAVPITVAHGDGSAFDNSLFDTTRPPGSTPTRYPYPPQLAPKSWQRLWTCLKRRARTLP
jgi:hypothetical protein